MPKGRSRLVSLLVGLAFVLLRCGTGNAFAQSADVGISGVGLVSVQPVDQTYVGGPYLSAGIGGFDFGLGAGLSVIASGGLVVAAELSTARFRLEQSGRLVGGSFPNEGVGHTTRLHDSLLSGLIGYAWSRGDTRTVVLGGISAKLDKPTIDGKPAEPFGKYDKLFPLVLTGGIDVLKALNSHTAFLVGGRYSFVDRPEGYQYLGIGRHILRFSMGMRVSLS